MNRYLEKIAAELKPHSERALKKLDKEHGIILDHSTGSGKTITFLTALERAQKRDPSGKALIVAPASLQTNIDKEIKKHGLRINMKNVEVLSYEKAAIDADRLKKNKYMMAIADEAHKLRSVGTKRHKELSEIIGSADRRILATATPSYNHASDISPLVNIAAGGNKVLPEGKSAFEERFVQKSKTHAPFLKRIFGAPSKEVESLKNTGELSKTLNKYVDSYTNDTDKEAAKHFPTTTEKVVEVEMSPVQHQMYKYMEGKLPFHLRMKVRTGMPLDKKESAQLNAFSSGVRQVSNSVTPFMPKYSDTTPKIKAAVDSVAKGISEDKNFKGLVYSNYLGSGAEDYSKELTKRGIKHAVYHGGLSKKEKDALANDFSYGKNKVLVISSSGAEGLDLKGVKKVQVLEPHFNKSKIKQVTGRAARYDSHAHLPAKERKVEVEHYQSIFPSGIFGKASSKSIDQYLHDNSDTKDELIDKIKRLTKND